MDTLISRYCLSLLLLTSIATSAGSNETEDGEPREPRVSGRIVKLYSGAKPERHLCAVEGFQPDPSSCAAFYRCVKERSGKFTVFRYQCAPGTVYDPDLETCNHPRSTRRAECGGMLKPTADSHHVTNINEIDGAQSEVPRPISTKVPVYAEQTTLKNPTTIYGIISTERQNIPSIMPWTSTVYSSPSILSTSTTKLPDFSQHQWESQYTSKLPTKITQPSNSKNTEACTSDGFMGDNDNCRKFYRCVGNQRGGYVKYEFSCSESTVWDNEIKGCNHPWAVKRSNCGRSLSYNDKPSSHKQEPSATEKSNANDLNISNGGFGYKYNNTIQQQLQISHGSKVMQTQTQISNSPNVIQNQTQINYGDKVQNTSNSNFKQNQTQISNGTAVSQSQTQIAYGNKGVQTQLQIDHSKDSSQSQVQLLDSATQSTTFTPATNNGQNECSESGFMGDAYNCKKFYRCVNNGRGYTKYEYSCGDGTLWDPEIEACNHAWAVKQCGAKYPGADSSTESTTITTVKSTKNTEHTKTTQIYTTSQVPDPNDEDDVGYGNQNTQEVTPSSTTSTKSTTTTEKSTTQNPSGSNTECTNSGFMGDTNDCKVFYRCVDNGNSGFIKYEFKCGDGTVWDPDIEACNHAWAVKKCGGYTSSGTEKEDTSTKKQDTISSENVHTTVTLVQISTQAPTQDDDYDTGYGSQNHESLTTTTSSSTNSTIATPPQDQNSSDSSTCKSSGFVGNVKDCKKFYRCVDNGNGGYIKYEFMCGQGTLWDSKIDACNHAWAVEKCGGSNIIDESSSYETTSQSSSTISSGDSNYSIHTTQNSQETETSPISTITTSSSTTNSGTSNKCSSSGFIVGDSSDCKRFYRCVDNGDGTFNRYEFTCGEGTVWDPKIEACNHAWAVEKCGSSADSVVTHEPQQTTSQRPTIQDEEQGNGYVTPSYVASETTQSAVASSSSSTTSTTLGECADSGFMGDKNDCKKFYRCVDDGKSGYDRYEFQCGEGTVWDGSIEACNHAWAVKDCGGSGLSTMHIQNESTTQFASSSSAYEDGQTQQVTEKTTTTTATQTQESGLAMNDECMQEGFYGNKKDCKKFYRCVDNGNGGLTKYEFTCGEGTYWNQDIQGCDHISLDRSCSSNTSQLVTTNRPTHLHDDMNDQATSTIKTTTTTEQTESESIKTTKTPQSSTGTCNSEGFYGDPLNCKKFYRCVANSNGGYTKYDFNCGDGTVWDQNIQACDHESSSKSCSISSSTQAHTTESQSESTTNFYSTTTKHETDKTETTESMKNQCTSEGFFAHTKDCKKFIRCVDNGNGGYTSYEFSCGDGTVWVQEIQACDHDNDLNSCSSGEGFTISSQLSTQSTSRPSNTENISSSTSSSSVTSSTESKPSNDEYDTQKPNAPSHDETDDCISDGYFANKQDCRMFYRCVENGKGGYTKYDFVCGEGTAWDSNVQTCNHINEVQSCSGATTESNGNHQTTTSKNQAESEGTASSTTKATTSSESSSSSSSQDTCKSEGYFGDSNDCKKFYRCVDNGKGGYTKYDYTCGEGTIWDQEITTCNHPQDVSNPSCRSSQGSSDTSSTTSSTTSSSEATSSTTEGSSSSSQSTTDCSQESSKKPANNDATCDKAGFYANSNDCKKFYRCVDWDGDGKRFSVFHFECGEGTIWDPALDTCNHEESVYPQRDCSQTQSQSVEGETTSNTTEDPTTTTESTTSEHTTQESTSEHTAAQQTTTKKTTTEQSNEPTTTQQTTTSEKTTTQESTTSEQTTTQQTTTSEKTTTQESTTSEQTTTQHPTTSEQSTTQQSTTSEQTTTEQSTTSEPTTSKQTTTEQTTTSEQTTTQQSTTSEQTTTQQSTTSETTSQQTTTEQTTTEQSSTTQESSTTEHITTQESTTSEQTTQESSTSEQTTTEQSNETVTEQSSTTTEQTTDGTTTTDSSTEGTTTEETTDQSTSQTSSTESTSSEGFPATTEDSSREKECPETEDDQYLLVCPTSFKRHPKYCNMFYQCTEDDDTYETKVAMFKCPNNSIYDESQTQCVAEDKADKKCDGEIASKRKFKRLGPIYKELIVADKGNQSCTGNGYFAFEKHSECAKGFLKCENSKSGEIRGYVYQCPDGYVYWSISKRCERIESVRDCKRSDNDWTGRWNIPIERKNVATS